MVRRKEVVAAHPGLDLVWEEVSAAFPVGVTRSFWDRMELGNPADPLARQALPDPRELADDEEDLLDPVGELQHCPVPWVVHKHRDRVLLLLTKRCHLYCRYCFRRTHQPTDHSDPTVEEWEAALEYTERSGAREVILSGGDPLAVPDHRLLATIDRLKPAIPVVRLHTRAPITLPERVTERLVSGLASRGPVWVVVHCNHPNELSAEVDEALARFVDAGIPVLNQSVLLAGVNDDVDVLAALCEALVARRVFPYYLHHPDRVRGNAHLRVTTERGLALYRELRGRISGVALPSYVLDRPDGSGKIPVAEVERP